jgi:Lrp/AsnC family transcriptional regulator for asnA, asnC and gidA
VVNVEPHPAKAATPLSVLRRGTLSELELALIGMLQQDGRRSFAAMARELKTSEKSVRSTVERLLSDGVIEITAVTFPDLAGYTGAANCGIRVSAPHSVRDVAAALAEVPSIGYVAVTNGSFDIFIDVVCRDRQALLQLLDESVRPIPGIERIETFLYLALPYREIAVGARLPLGRAPKNPDFKLHEVDRHIIRELAINGRESYQSIGRGLGISEGQVRQRVKRATESGVLSISAIVNPAVLGYEVMTWVALRATDGRASDLARELSELASTSYVIVTAGRYNVFVELLCRDEPELSKELELLGAWDLVESLEPFVYFDLFFKPQQLP